MYNTAKFFAKIIRPLVGHNGHHIINSEGFTNKIADLKVPPWQKLVSYDVSALFTSIPINEAIPVVRAKLEDDLHYQSELLGHFPVCLPPQCWRTRYGD